MIHRTVLDSSIPVILISCLPDTKCLALACSTSSETLHLMMSIHRRPSAYITHHSHTHQPLALAAARGQVQTLRRSQKITARPPPPGAASHICGEVRVL
jgi:hypothetical protein